MSHALTPAVGFPPTTSPTSALATFAHAFPAMTPAIVAPGTCWLMSTPINLYALAFRAAEMTVQANQLAWHRRHETSRN